MCDILNLSLKNLVIIDRLLETSYPLFVKEETNRLSPDTVVGLKVHILSITEKLSQNSVWHGISRIFFLKMDVQEIRNAFQSKNFTINIEISRWLRIRKDESKDWNELIAVTVIIGNGFEFLFLGNHLYEKRMVMENFGFV